MDLEKKILSDITVHMKYARYLDEYNRRENWEELVTRNMKMHMKKFPNLKEMYDRLYQINLKLWEIEDKVRMCEKNDKFDQSFIDLARNVYQTNDLRFTIKNEINEYLNSDIKEQKSYEQY